MAEKFTTELSGSLIFRNDTANTTITPGLNALGVTGSLNVSGSDITLNGSSIVSRIEALEAGGADSVSLIGLNAHSASVNTFTGSASSRLDSLQAATSSYLTSIPDGTVSSSAQIESLGFVTSSGDSIPAGTISSSAQIENLGFITGDDTGSFLTGADTGSFLTNSDTGSFVDANITGSLINTGSVSSNTLTFTKGDGTSFSLTVDTGSGAATPDGTVSSSAQIEAVITDAYISSSAAASGFGSGGGGGSTDISALNTFTGSAEARLDAIELASGAYATTGSNTFIGQQTFSGSLIPEANGQNNGIHDLGSLNAPWQDLYLTTASLKFVRDGQLVSTVSGEANAIRVGNILITTSSISVVSGSGNSLTTVQNVVQATVSSSGEVTETNQVLAPDGTVSGSAQITALGFIKSASLDYDGNRVVSNDKLGDLFTDSFNAGTSGSIEDFLNAIFFPNSSPTITTGNQTIAEFLTSGSSVVTIAGTDPEGQTLTFGTASSYTDDFFRVASNGAMTLNALATASFNTTDRGDGTLAHPIVVTATDTFNASVSKTIYVRVTPNAAPVFREVSTGGSIISSFTTSRNENASTGEVTKIYFTDAESDTITIESSSIPGDHFTITKYATYVSIAQATASLDYETTSSYSFSITASDSHYQDGDDVDSVTTLPITINVTDNVIPTINNQTLTGFSEDENDGDSSKQISATDSEGDTIVFKNFTLAGLKNGSSDVSIGTYTGASQSDPDEDPFQMNSSGQVTRKSSQFINSDLIDTYIYSASVTDAYNTTSASAAITISIADDVAPSITSNGSFYIIESALDGASVTTATSGIAGTAARYTVSNGQSVTWTISPSSKFAINSSGYITLSADISGSHLGGENLNVNVTASNSFGTETTDTFTVTVTDNSAPSITATPTNGNLNTNGARPGNTLYTLTFSDPDGDPIDYDSFTFTGSANLVAVKTGNDYIISSSANLTAGDYQFTASISDTGSFDTTTTPVSFTVAQAPIGSLTTNGTFRIIESATDGNEIKISTNGRTGTQADLGVTYSPSYNSAAVQSFTSSNAAIDVDSSGNLTIGVNLSGSATASGDTITSDITFRDQYDNIGSGSITVNVVANNAPTATFTNQNANLTASIAANTNLVSVTITDDESDTPFSMSLSGTDASSLKAVPQNANSSSYQIQAASTLSAATYNFSASVFDNFDKSTNYNRDLTVVSQKGLVYGYGINWAANPSSETAFFGTAGDTGGNGSDINSGSVIAHLISGSIGSSFDTSYGATATVTLYHSASLTTLSDTGTSGVSSLGYFDFSGGAEHVLIVFPSASNQFGKPATMYDGTPPDSNGTDKEYYLYAKDASIPGTVSSGIYYFDVLNTTEGSDTWGFVFAEGKNTNNSRYYLMPDSASAP